MTLQQPPTGSHSPFFTTSPIGLACALVLGVWLGGCSFDASGLGGNGPGGGEPTEPPPPPNADPLLGCSAGCHGDETSTAPPRDLQGGTSTDLRTVGAHRSHLAAAPTQYRKVLCEDCHLVPEQATDPGHMDTAAPAEVTFGAVATAAGSPATWDGDTCTVYCHGATLDGGALTTPQWTVVDGSQSQCGNCHGFPPPMPHPEANDCGTCHPTVQPGTVRFLDPESHINGQLDLSADVMPCDACHGGNGVSAPPPALDGSTDRASRGVGAHREHIGTSDWHRELFCAQCHQVPKSVDTPGHIDGDDRAEVIFDNLNPDGKYNVSTGTCSDLYCHSNGGSELGRMEWTDDLELGCDGCHADGTGNGRGITGEHDKHFDENIECRECHGAVVDGNLNIVTPDLHINGLHEVDIAQGGTWDPAERTCTNLVCHEDEEW